MSEIRLVDVIRVPVYAHSAHERVLLFQLQLPMENQQEICMRAIALLSKLYSDLKDHTEVDVILAHCLDHCSFSILNLVHVPEIDPERQLTSSVTCLTIDGMMYPSVEPEQESLPASTQLSFLLMSVYLKGLELAMSRRR